MKQSDFVFTGTAVTFGVLLAIAGAGSCVGVHSEPLSAKRLELERVQDQFCAIRAMVRDAERDAGIEVPGAR